MAICMGAARAPCNYFDMFVQERSREMCVRRNDLRDKVQEVCEQFEDTNASRREFHSDSKCQLTDMSRTIQQRSQAELVAAREDIDRRVRVLEDMFLRRATMTQAARLMTLQSTMTTMRRSCR